MNPIRNRLMNPIRNSVGKYVSIASASITGILLLFLMLLLSLNSGIMNPEFHRNLFIKHDIYSYAYNVIDNTIDDFINRMEDSLMMSSESFHLQERLLENLENSVTPELVKTNLDLIREGIFQYFRGERVFLPDVYLSRNTEGGNAHPDSAPAGHNLFYGNSLDLINKINLNAVFHYMGRNDITDNLHVLKMFYFISQRLPRFLIHLIILSLLGGFALSRGFKEFSGWICLSWAVCGIFCLILGVALAFCTNAILPEQIYPITGWTPPGAETITAYLKDCIMYSSVFLAIAGILFLVLAAGIYGFSLRFSSCISSVFPVNIQNSRIKSLKHYGTIKYTAFSLLFIIILTSISYNLAVLRKEFQSNNFSRAVSRLMNRNNIIQVVAASDDAVYSLHVRINDEKENKPLSGIVMNISGKSGRNGSVYDKNMVTDENGFARLELDKGEFCLSFPVEAFPEDYIIPSPVNLDLKTPGTTIITVNLKIDEEKKKPGVVEIEVLDPENKPVPDLELYVKESAGAQGEPENIYSRTNADGIAAFKLLKGNCTIDFTLSTFPENYIYPGPVKTSVVPGKVTRYTIQLSGADKQLSIR